MLKFRKNAFRTICPASILQPFSCASFHARRRRMSGDQPVQTLLAQSRLDPEESLWRLPLGHEPVAVGRLARRDRGREDRENPSVRGTGQVRTTSERDLDKRDRARVLLGHLDNWLSVNEPDIHQDLPRSPVCPERILKSVCNAVAVSVLRK